MRQALILLSVVLCVNQHLCSCLQVVLDQLALRGLVETAVPVLLLLQEYLSLLVHHHTVLLYWQFQVVLLSDCFEEPFLCLLVVVILVYQICKSRFQLIGLLPHRYVLSSNRIW